MPAQPSLTLVRRIKAPPARVFEAFVRPDLVARWYGPDRGPVTHAELDVRVGGGFRIGFRTEDGEQHETVGTYRTIEPGHLLVYTLYWVSFPERISLVTVRLAPTAEGTELTLLHEQLHDEDVLARVTVGWGGTLDKLQTLLEPAPSPA